MRAGHKLVVGLWALASGACFPPQWGADMILHAWRRPITTRPDIAYKNVSFPSGDVLLKGWMFRTRAPRRALIVYLHGISDNRESGLWLAERFLPRGYD